MVRIIRNSNSNIHGLKIDVDCSFQYYYKLLQTHVFILHLSRQADGRTGGQTDRRM